MFKKMAVAAFCILGFAMSAVTQTVTGSGTTNTVPVFTGTSTVGNSPITVSGSNVGIGTTVPVATLQIAGGSYSLSNLTAEKEFSLGVTNGVANQKIDFYMTGAQAFSGVITVDVTDTYEYQDAAGMISKRFALGLNPNNEIWNNESHYVEDSGVTADNWAISDLSWDATNSRYKITLIHRVSTANLPSVRLIAFAENGTSIANFLTFTAGPVYTTDATVYGRPYISFNNNVGIGTTSPGAKLEVSGNVKLTSGSGASITFADGTSQTTAWTGVLCGGDYAESVDVSGDRTKYGPGDVLVIDAGDSGRFLKSAEPYSTAVLGIYSTRPGALGRRQTTPKKTDEVPMAMIGIVPTKVSAENGPIHPGDLLVTSSTSGYAMKGTDRSRMLGAVIGKAMNRLDSGTGVIEVGVMLQ